ESVPDNNLKIIKAKARDQFSIIDVDHDSTAVVSAAVGLDKVSGAHFVDGILLLDTLQYTSVGDGTLTLTSMNGLGQTITSNVNQPGATPPNVAVSSTHVDVINVYAELTTEGVTTSTNLSGGSVSKAIFGVTFRRDYAIAGHPILQKFRIQFTNSYKGVLNQIRIYENAAERKYTPGDPNLVNVTSVGGNLVQDADGLWLDVDLTGTPGGGRSLTSTSNGQLTYFMVVDVAADASSNTPKIRPYVVDDGLLTGSADYVVTSSGSDYAGVQGQEYSFAAIFPPVLTATYPAIGQLNVDPTQPTMELLFNRPVWSLDGVVALYDQTDPDNVFKVGDLQALNGQYNHAYGTDDPQNTANLTRLLEFQMPALQPDHFYYITVEPATTTYKTGIMDQNRNRFGGITYSGEVYFKTSNGLPPTLLTTPTANENPSLITPDGLATGAIWRGAFDEPGRAFYMVVPAGSDAPTVAQIKDPAATYPDGALGQATGDRTFADTINITKINPLTNFGLISSLEPETAYDVYVYAEAYSERDSVETAIPNSNPFRGAANGFTVGVGSPTFTFTTPVAPVSPAPVSINSPAMTLCVNSEQEMSAPIIISEGDIDDFYGGGSTQSFNLLLPSGFEFIPSAGGTVMLAGEDFAGTGEVSEGTLKFINNSIIKISFVSDENVTRDFIAIHGLKVKATSSTSGYITRLGGNAFPADVPDDTNIAYLDTYDATSVDFTNSYSKAEFSQWNTDHPNDDGTYQSVTTIPDNYNEAGGRTVELIPLRPEGDYGPNTFSGFGVNLNELSLGAVNVGTPFNITMMHTDNNGCVSETVIQYLVYDHTKALPDLANTYCFVNENYPGMAANDQADTVNTGVLTGYLLYSVKAAIPADVAGAQVMTGAAWETLVSNWPSRIDSIVSPANNPNPEEYPTYARYYLEESHLLNANDTAGATVNNLYDYPAFHDAERTDKGMLVHKGGSLGIIEFTAEFQSTTNSDIQVPIKQRVEYFIPARPIVEAYGESAKEVYNGTVDQDSVQIFCRSGAPIIIKGYPKAVQGSATGEFEIFDDETNAPLSVGFTDNGNGTASLNPMTGFNMYRDIRIEYTYHDVTTPCSATGTLVIRIRPNPIPEFRFENLCRLETVRFFDESITVTGDTIVQWDWNFADPNSLQNTSALEDPTHIYENSGVYPNVSLNVKSEYNCWSVSPREQSLTIGDTINMAFSFMGVTNELDFDASASTTNNDVLKYYEWHFGDDSVRVDSTSALMEHTYDTLGTLTVRLIITSEKGCTNELEKRIVVLPSQTVATEWSENFAADGGDWQTLGMDGTPDANVSWHYDGAAGRKYWTTDTYSPRERSALYSPVFNLSTLTRPIITFMDSINLMNNDGVVLEYSTDNRNVADAQKVWNRLGADNTTGVNWYNNDGVLLSSPGNNTQTGDYAWVGTGKEGEASVWRHSKHSLSDITNRSRVVFRFALGSVNNSVTLPGFFLDSVRIGDGTRTVLMENFSNTSFNDNTAKAQNAQYRSFLDTRIGIELVKIDYHVAFPDGPTPDPFNELNPSDPGARALYYNVSELPRTHLDGSDAGSFEQWSSKFSKIVLDLAQVEIDPVVEVENDSVKISGTFTALHDLGGSNLLHIAVVEENIDVALNSSLTSRIASGETQFRYVLKKLLPSAAGTKVGALKKDSVYSFEAVYTNPQVFANANDLAVVVFVQHETSRNVYNAAIVRNVSDPGVNVGVDPEIRVGLYPNPADEEFFLDLGRQVSKRTPVLLFDQMGKIVKETYVDKGQRSTTIGTATFAAGVYVIHVQSEHGLIVKKVMVVHQH
ncbi:MAG TPA: PKD domain-containing protein, partial [Chryseosolibacter sp.]|nr:PKD domain-containing protein [Chryseosolibacter sp.]